MYLFLSDFNEILNFSWQLLASLSCQIIKRICPTTGSDIRSHRWNGMTSYSIFFYYVKNALKSNHDYLNTTSSNRKTNVFSKQITTTKTRYQQSLLYMTYLIHCNVPAISVTEPSFHTVNLSEPTNQLHWTKFWDLLLCSQ